MSYGKAVRDELRVPTRELRHAIPQVYAGYKELHDSALAPGVLDARTKELIALAIAVSKECDGCIAAHAPRGGPSTAPARRKPPRRSALPSVMNGGPRQLLGARASAPSRSWRTSQRMSQPVGLNTELERF